MGLKKKSSCLNIKALVISTRKHKLIVSSCSKGKKRQSHRHCAFSSIWNKSIDSSKKSQCVFFDCLLYEGIFENEALKVRALNYTGWLQKEWLIRSPVSYSVSVVMCWDYRSDKKTWQGRLLWSRKEINGYFTHRITHKNTLNIAAFFLMQEGGHTCCTSHMFACAGFLKPHSNYPQSNF